VMADRIGRRVPLTLNVPFYAIIFVLVRVGTKLLDLPNTANAVRDRYGRPMGSRSFAGPKSVGPKRRGLLSGRPSGRIHAREPPGRGGLQHRIPSIRLAHALLSRRTARIVVSVYLFQGQGITCMARAPGRIGRPIARLRCAIGADSCT
jgi:hypothetical protein